MRVVLFNDSEILHDVIYDEINFSLYCKKDRDKIEVDVDFFFSDLVIT